MRALLFAIVLALLPSGLAVSQIDGAHRTSAFMPSGVARTLHGRASYYGNGFIGRPTASGERYEANAMTAAHRTLPLGTKVRIVDPSTRRAVVVRINDRGPYVRGRTVDLSRRAAQLLGITQKGVANVTIEIVSLPG